MYAEHVREIQEMELGYASEILQHIINTSLYSGRKISLFLSGDYEFLTRMYGLSGASGKKRTQSSQFCGDFYCIIGRHCCLWCHITSADLKKPLSERGRHPERSLETLQSDLQRFTASGGDIAKAKLHNNVIAPIMLDIPLDKVPINNTL
jgi:hypothetical protein